MKKAKKALPKKKIQPKKKPAKKPEKKAKAEAVEEVLAEDSEKKPKLANTMTKVTCPDCKEDFDIDKNLYEAGDIVECPECHSVVIVEVKSGKFCLASEKEKYFDDDSEEAAEEAEE